MQYRGHTTRFALLPPTPPNSFFPSLFPGGMENHLSAAEERDGLPGIAVGHDRIPHLRRASTVSRLRHAIDRALARGAQVIGLELDGGEPGRAFGQARDAAVA